MAFQTIHATPGLSPGNRRRAHRSGPWAVASTRAPEELLDEAGFVDIEVVDQTKAFRATAAAWFDQWAQHRDPLVDFYGESDVETRQAERRTQLHAIDDGLLRRSLTVGRRPVT